MELMYLVGGIGLGVASLAPLWWKARSQVAELQAREEAERALPARLPMPEEMPGWVFHVDDDGAITWANLRARIVFESNLLGRPFERILADWGSLDAQWNSEGTSPGRRASGASWRLYTTAPVLPVEVQREPSPAGWWVTLRDLTKEHQHLERLTKANARIQERLSDSEAASKAKTTYLAGVAQVLRTPLTTIMGYTELVIEELTDRGLQQAARDVRRVQVAANTLHTVLEAVLDWTEIEAGRMSVRSQAFEASEALLEVVEACRQKVEQDGNVFQVDVPEGLRILGDDKRTRQIVGQLIENAARFTQDGEVRIRARQVGKMIVIAVEDTGQGMEAGELEELLMSMERRQGRTTSTRTGMSLLLAHTFAKMMGGSLTVRSGKGRGTDFMLELPMPDDTQFSQLMMLDG